jgi:hypothetical protein
MDIITLNALTRALMNRVGITNLEARKVAGFVLDLFGYDDRIIDNVLEPKDRQLFYILEAEGLLSTGREETRLPDGREWLTHYWEIKRHAILHYANIKTRKLIVSSASQSKEQEKQKGQIYTNLSDDVWMSRKKPMI